MVMLNHICHHRGQLSVCLRMLEVAVPWIYVPSADENPFVFTTADTPFRYRGNFRGPAVLTMQLLDPAAPFLDRLTLRQRQRLE